MPPARTTPTKTKSIASLRVGAVNYLNSKPLVHGLEGRLSGFPLRFDLPSRLADSLAFGRLDVALIPVVEALREPKFRIVSDACVASDGPVLSVKVYFRTRPEQVRSLALDEGSRTSAALAQVLLAERHGVRPELTALPIGCGSESADTDAVLLIGDRAMHPATEPFVAEWDLGAEWRATTGLPFVFACWAARPDVDDDALDSVAIALNGARDAGVAATAQIAANQAPLLGVPKDFAARYLTTNLHYRLGVREQKAVRLFEQRCRMLGLLNAARASACPE